MHYLTDNDRYRAAALAVVVVCSVLICFYSISNPLNSWDMLGYAASVYSVAGVDPALIHSSVYSELRAYATPENFIELTEGTDYRSVMSTDPNAFNQQIPFYKIRILYVLLLLGLTKLGLGVFEAMHLVSAAFGGVGFLILYLGLREKIHSLVWISTPLVLYGISRDFAVMQTGGVDAFAFFWVVFTFVAYIKYNKYLLPLLAVGVLVRTDLVIHAGLLFGVLFLVDKSNRAQLVFWGFACLAMYFGINSWAGNYGWTTLIYFAIVSDMSATHPEIYSQYSFNTREYIGFIFNSTKWISNWVWLSLICALMSMLMYIRYCHTSVMSSRLAIVRSLNIVSALCLLYVVLHYLLFPLVLMRFFVGQCLFMFLSFFTTLGYVYSTKWVSSFLDIKKETRQTI